MILVIQTNIPQQLDVWLLHADGSVFLHQHQMVNFHGSENVVRMVDQVISRAKKPPQRILIVRGPGPFTAVRTGLMVANTLAWILRIPILGITSLNPLSEKNFFKLARRRFSRTEVVTPEYGKAPNITTPKQ